MKLRNLRIQNVKLLRDFQLDFTNPDNSPRQWTILVGRNGTGKSTILQSIALAAGGGGIVNSLTSAEVDSFTDRRPADHATSSSGLRAETEIEIKAEFALPPLGPELKLRPHPVRPFPDGVGNGRASTLTSVLHMPTGGKLFTAHESLLDDEGVPLPIADEQILFDIRGQSRPWWFVAGYGTRRFLTTGTRRASRPHEQRLDSLFTTQSGPLIGLGFADRQEYSRPFVQRFLDLLKIVLVGADGERGITPLIRNLELRGAGGAQTRDLAEKDRFELDLPGTDGLKVPATYLSHGYQSTVAWIADLIGQFLLDFIGDEYRLRRLKPESMTGLVLIDELDLFLHPDWQTGFIGALSAAFPNMQFVVTTHSPLLIADRRPSEVVLLDWNDAGDIVPRPFDGDPRLMNSAELYRRVFGLHDTPPTPLALDVSQYNYLAGKRHRTDDEEVEVQQLRAHLDAEGVTGLEPISPRGDG